MIFYTAIDDEGRTHWEKTQVDARAINKNFDQVDVPTDKPGLHVWLNAIQTQLDDLRLSRGAEEAPEALSVPVQAPAPPSYAHQSVSLDEQFDKLPIAHQLHFAAIAMENARSLL